MNSKFQQTLTIAKEAALNPGSPSEPSQQTSRQQALFDHDSTLRRILWLTVTVTTCILALATFTHYAHAQTATGSAGKNEQKDAQSTAQKTFATPAEAVSAMADAVKANDAIKLRAILGPGGGKLIHSGDSVYDEQHRKSFTEKYDAASTIRMEGDARAIVLVGKDEWPMPIPLVKSASGWRFDTKQGSQEILKRRIGRNELSAMEVVRAIVDAQREYVAKDQDKNGLLEYAPKIISTAGKHDGLYWEASASEPQSPLGPLIAAAAKDGYVSPAVSLLDPNPYHGYYYRILSKQGKNASGGAYEYMVKGKMIGGFAIVAYPARYGVSGITSFVANHDGVVYEKDLGKNTSAIAEKMAAFDPDSSWKRP